MKVRGRGWPFILGGSKQNTERGWSFFGRKRERRSWLLSGHKKERGESFFPWPLKRGRGEYKRP